MRRILLASVFSLVALPALAQGISGPPSAINNLLGASLSSPGLTASIWSGQLGRWSLGTTAAPTTTAGAMLQLSKTQQILSATCGGNAFDASCDPVISAIVTNTVSDQMQVTGIFSDASTKTGSDAVGMFSIGDSLNGATGIGTGAYLQGTAEIGGGKALGAEIRSANNTGVAGTYQSSGFSGTGSLWLTAGGTAISAEAIGVGGVSGQSFLYGLACKSGSVSAGCARDDSSSTTSVTINGTHTSAISLGANAGLVNLGVQVAEKLRIFDGTSVPTSYGFGISGGDMQSFIGGTANQFSWRGAGYGSSTVMTLSGLGVLALPLVATGTPAASLCIDASNNIIKKTTTGACI